MCDAVRYSLYDPKSQGERLADKKHAWGSEYYKVVVDRVPCEPTHASGGAGAERDFVSNDDDDNNNRFGC